MNRGFFFDRSKTRRSRSTQASSTWWTQLLEIRFQDTYFDQHYDCRSLLHIWIEWLVQFSMATKMRTRARRWVCSCGLLSLSVFIVFCSRCESCLRLRETFACLRFLVEMNTNITDDIRHRVLYRLNHNVQLISDWKKHLLRTVHQEAARKHILDILDDSSIFIVADWAMKWLPTWYRESQREFFGKRGLPWHITYAIRAKSPSSSSSSIDTRTFEHRTFCHVFDNVKQDGRTVVSILSNVSFKLFGFVRLIRCVLYGSRY